MTLTLTDSIVSAALPAVELVDNTIKRLDALRINDESYGGSTTNRRRIDDQRVTERINIYEATELTFSYAGDRVR